ncbi:hypothetical protein BCU00_001745 [Vibrio breoganii]|uniref:NgoFVII family restriction endonuclease n=1 Tax=Vibrio breoganii TaxID=553239 RepID=UPI000C85BE8B|nr:NgoFVII family restriction endonuclease [Vibrio breoganii]PMK37665.1 NgoFVII family restriction endonuclease [Vibrio breoganii]
MADIIWNRFSIKEKEEYIQYLKIFGALSGLFKDNKEGKNARKPYLYYRNQEQLFIKVFTVGDLTRKDSAFDALAEWNNDRVGIGLKTWIHSADKTYQKVAEFNRLAPKFISPLIEKDRPEEVIKKVAEFRNERIMLDKRLHRTNRDIYHYITRDDNVMNIVEASYDLVDIGSLELIKNDKKTYEFKDNKNEYKFYVSKSVLQKKFDASQGEIIQSIDIEQFDDPFELIKMIQIPDIPNAPELPMVAENKEEYIIKQPTIATLEEIYLPLYIDSKEDRYVSPRSGINIRNSKPKTKNTNTPRPEFEIEIRVRRWIHHIFPEFFGLDWSDKEALRKSIEDSDFELALPDGRILEGRIKQENGKSLQTKPQGALGEWILKDVLGLKNREVATLELLDELGIDSLKVTKVNNKFFRITVAETGAYEKFKLDNAKSMKNLGLKGNQKPKFRKHLVEELVAEEN